MIGFEYANPDKLVFEDCLINIDECGFLIGFLLDDCQSSLCLSHANYVITAFLLLVSSAADIYENQRSMHARQSTPSAALAGQEVRGESQPISPCRFASRFA